MTDPLSVTGVVLAGGLARRMQNQDKGLLLYQGKPLVSYAIDALSPLTPHILVNANRNDEAYRQFGWPVIKDLSDRFDGPLAGILSAMAVAQTSLLLVVPCDAPLIAPSYLQRLLLHRALADYDVAVAFDGVRLHPVFLALKTSLRDNLQQYLENGERKMQQWLAQQHRVIVPFSDAPEIFTNINTLTQLTAL